MKIYTTELINKINDKYNKGEEVSRYDRVYFQNNEGVRKAGIMFSFTSNELKEYIKCKISVDHFANQCIRQLDGGATAPISLFDFQKDILNFTANNRFTINFASRQVGITTVHAIYLLWEALFNEKIIVNIANRAMTSRELLRKIKDIYKLLPFYLQVGVTSWNENQIVFENGSRIVGCSRAQPAIGYHIDILYLQEFSQMPMAENIYRALAPTITALRDSKIMIQTGANGYNFSYELIQKSELPEGHPDKNNFKTMRTYWYQVPGRDENWRREQITFIGGEAEFNQEFGLQFNRYENIKPKEIKRIISDMDPYGEEDWDN